jgi:hypothetical protein
VPAAAAAAAALAAVVVVETTAGGTTEPDRASGATDLDADDEGVPKVPVTAAAVVAAVVVVIVERGDVAGEVKAPEAATADFFNGAMGLPPGMAPYSRTNICSNSSTS